MRNFVFSLNPLDKIARTRGHLLVRAILLGVLAAVFVAVQWGTATPGAIASPPDDNPRINRQRDAENRVDRERRRNSSDEQPAIRGASYGELSGTSMAAPHVAGTAALLLSLNPGATPQQLKSWILQGVDPVASFSGLSVTGGRLNAANSLNLAASAGPSSASALPQNSTTTSPQSTFAPDFRAAHVPGRLLVVFDNKQISSTNRASAHSIMGASVVDRYNLLDADLVSVPSGVSLEESAREYARLPGVAFVQPDYIYYASGTPDDPDFDLLWGMNNTGQTGGTADADIDAPEAWDITTGSGNVIVAVIDSGVDYTHPDLAANMWVNPGEIPGNGLDDDNNGFVDDVHGYDFANDDGDPYDDFFHGTHVAGTVGAVGNNGLGVAGVAWNVKIMAIKFLAPDPVACPGNACGTTSDAISAINYAVANGAHLTNNSWGGGPGDPALFTAIQNAGQAGQLFVTTSGNFGQNIETFPFYPGSFNLDNIITVAATDHNDGRAIFSSYGAVSVDLAAPGVDVYSTMPVNNPPSIVSTPVTTATQDIAYSYDVDAIDPDFGDSISHTLDIAPIGMTIGSVSGLISWTPNSSQVGLNNVTVRATDLDGAFDTQAFVIDVQPPPNNPPTIISVPVTTATEGAAYSYDVDATDPDAGDVLAYSLDVAPVGMSIDSVSGLISWTPDSSQVGPNSVTARVEDISGDFDTQSFVVDVQPDTPPPASAIIDAQIGGSSDDAYHIVAGWPGYSSSSSVVFAGAPGSGPAKGGWRWNNLAIPEGVTITDAYVEFNQSGWGNQITTTLAFENGISPNTFSSSSSPFHRWSNHTVFEIDWSWVKNVPGSWIRTPSLAAGIQELVNNHGGIDSLVLLEDGTGVAGGNYHSWVSYDSNPALSARLHIEYGGSNNPPSITSTPLTTATEDAIYSYDVDATDPDAGDTLTYSLDVAPVGMSIDAVSGLVSWTPDNSQVGLNNVTVRVEDLLGDFDTQSFAVDVANVNDQPSITSAPVTTATEDLAYAYDVDASDPDVGDVLAFSLDAAPTGMTIDPITGLVSWTPDNSHVGSNNVTVRVTDLLGLFDTQAFAVDVANVNDQPVVTSTPLTAATEDSLYSYDVDATDPDVGDVLTYSFDTAPVGMTIHSASGLISWTPDNSQVGLNNVTVRVEDLLSEFDTQAFVIDVVNVNDEPSITSVAIVTATEDVLYSYDVDASDLDAGDSLTFSLDASPSGMSIDSASGVISWTPDNSQVGLNNVTVRVEDLLNAFDTQSFSVDVANVNDAPSITSAAVTTATEDADYSYDVDASDPDVGDSLTFSLDVSPTGMSIDSISGLISWMPDNSQVGLNNVTVRVADLSGEFDIQSFVVDVANTNDAPVITSAAVTSATEDSSYSYDVDASDPDTGDGLAYSLDVAPIGMSIDSVSGLISWTPDNSHVGLNNVTVRVEDSSGDFDTQSFAVDVTNVNDPPSIISIPVTTATEDALYSYAVDTSDPDVGDSLTYSLDVAPAGMSINSASGLISWLPDNSQVGVNNVTVRVEDLLGLFDTQSFAVDVANANDPPSITSTPVTVATEDSPYSYDVDASDPDVGDTLSFSLDVAPAGMMIDSAAGLISWTPDNSQVGINSVTVRVIDALGLFDTQSFSVDVANVNDQPSIVSVPVTTAVENTLYSYDVDASDPDVGDSLTYSVDVAPPGMAIDSATGLVTWTPASSQIGLNNVTVRVTDLLGAFDTQSFVIDVQVDSPPPSSGVVDIQIGASTDDAYHVVSGWPGYNDSSGVVYAGSPGAGPAQGGWRWTGLAIPAGVTITEAYVEFNQAGWGHSLTTTLAFEDSDAPDTFSAGSSPFHRWGNRTTFEVDWSWGKSAPGSWIRTPSLVAGLQELVNNHGGMDSLVLLEDGTDVFGGDYHSWVSFDGNAILSARLHVVYEAN